MLVSQGLLQNGCALQGLSSQLAQSLGTHRGLGSSSTGACQGSRGGGRFDLRVGLSPQLIFYWDRNVGPEDLITNPVDLNLAWGGGNGCWMGAKVMVPNTRQKLCINSPPSTLSTGSSSRLHPAIPPPPGGLNQLCSQRAARTHGPDMTRDTAQGATWHLAHTQLKHSGSVPSEASWSRALSDP